MNSNEKANRIARMVLERLGSKNFLKREMAGALPLAEEALAKIIGKELDAPCVEKFRPWPQEEPGIDY